jgi:alpha-soluble NSF attachment protein
MSSRGDEFFASAEKKLTSFSVFNKNGKFTDAAELFIKAGNSYKSVREWAKAGHAYTRAADCHIHVNNLADAAGCAADSGKMYAKDPEHSKDAITAFRQAVQFHRENSKPTQAAKLLADAAKVFQETGDLDAAIEALNDAAQLYDDENQPMQAVTHLSAIADLLSMQKKWLEAAKAYKDVGIRRCQDRLTQMVAGEFFLKSVICQLAADDSVGGENLLREFVGTLPGWERSREYGMLAGIVQAVNDRAPDAFATAIQEYDQVKRLDKWMTETLLVVKKLIEGDDDIC